MEGMQTCLHGAGEKCLPKGPETQQASLEYTVIPAKHYLQAAHGFGSHYRLSQQHNTGATEQCSQIPQNNIYQGNICGRNMCVVILALNPFFVRKGVSVVVVSQVLFWAFFSLYFTVYR